MSRARKPALRVHQRIVAAPGDAHQQSVIHALRVAQQGEHLEDVLVLLYGTNDRFLGRIDAQSAQLRDHYWVLNDAFVSGNTATHLCIMTATTCRPH